jgi:hypothetical protein
MVRLYGLKSALQPLLREKPETRDPKPETRDPKPYSFLRPVLHDGHVLTR